MRLGGYYDTDTKHILNWNELKQLEQTQKFGGGWTILHASKRVMPNRRDRDTLILTLTECKAIQPVTLITARICKCPSSMSSIKGNSLLIIAPNKAHLTRFNGTTQINAEYKDIKIIPSYNQIHSHQPKYTVSPKKQIAPKPVCKKIPTVVLSDLSSPESSVGLNDKQKASNLSQPYPSNIPTEQEILQTSLGIDASLVIPKNGKVVYNYAVQLQQLQSKPNVLNENVSPSDSIRTLSRSGSSTPSRKRCYAEFSGYNGDDERVGENNDSNDDVPSPKRQKVMVGTSYSESSVITLQQKEQIEQNRLAARERLKLHKMSTDIDRVYVVDLETTSFPPQVASVQNGHVIIEVAIVQFNRNAPKLYQVKPVFHCFIDPETYDKYPDKWKKSWIFEHGTSVDMVKSCGMNAKLVIPEIRRILNGNYITSFNTDFDLIRFLRHAPYNVEYKEFECVMKLCGKEMNLIMPSLRDAARHFLGLDYVSCFHNAMEDALTAAKILAQVVVD